MAPYQSGNFLKLNTREINSNVDFDLGACVVNLTGSTLDAFELVLNADIEFIWVSRLGNNQDDFGSKIIPELAANVSVVIAFLPATAHKALGTSIETLHRT